MRQLANPQYRILTPPQAADFAAVLHVLADPTRLRIVSLLAVNGPMRGTDLAPHVAVTQPTVVHHLGKLLCEGFVTRRKRGRDVLFTLAPETLDYVASFLAGPR